MFVLAETAPAAAGVVIFLVGAVEIELRHPPRARFVNDTPHEPRPEAVPPVGRRDVERGQPGREVRPRRQVVSHQARGAGRVVILKSHEGGRIVLRTEVRTELVNERLPRLLILTLVGGLPGVVSYSFLGAGLVRLDDASTYGVFLMVPLVLLILVSIVIHLLRRKAGIDAADD